MNADQLLQSIIEAEWPVRVAALGSLDPLALPESERYLLPQVDEPSRQRIAERWTAVQRELDRVDPEALSAPARTDLEVFRFQLQVQLDHVRWRLHQWSANSDTAFWTALTGRTPDQFSSVADAEAFTDMLRQIPDHVRQQIENLRAGLSRGFGPAAVSMRGRDSTVAAIAQATDPRQTSLFEPYLRLERDVPAAAATVEHASELIRHDVIPVFGELHAFLVNEYLPHLPSGTAATDLPDGAEFYSAQLREYTTTELSAEQIHRIGLSEVDSIRGEMCEVAESLGYTGADGVQELLTFMRTDQQFFATTREQLLQLAAWECKKFDNIAHHYFGRMPRRRFGIVEPPPALAPTYTAGRGGNGRYVLNTYDLPSRPTHSIPALTLHEAAPGHAFQIPFAKEMDLPRFRRLIYISAYGEGWGLYCERLGDEMGIYETPYQRMGMLSFQMWRAVRLVIDPGIHALGWSRERAVDYLLQHTALSKHDVVTEVDRYITWPGQACAYYLGMLEIRRLREQAEAELGQDFDLRAFHDCVLSLGSVPLAVLAANVEAFIADGGRSPFADDQPDPLR